MIYVFDSGPFINVFNHYYPENFPSFWEKFNQYVQDNRIVSVRAVKAELINREDVLSDFVKNHDMFTMPTNEETAFVATIFENTHFTGIINQKARLLGREIADPYVIAKAKIMNACVVTQEKYKLNAAKIPNVCESFDIPCVSLEEFMKQEGWAF